MNNIAYVFVLALLKWNEKAPATFNHLQYQESNFAGDLLRFHTIVHLPKLSLFFCYPFLAFLFAASYQATDASTTRPPDYLAFLFFKASAIAACLSSSVNSFFSSCSLASAAFLAFCFSFFFRFASRFFSSTST